ncbi:MAG: Dabb family protein [Ignavibacteria bacterium]|nr:Dabb family protein [Ignavibacteria bacterium]
MIRHIVIWRFQEHADGRTKSENLLRAKSLLEALPDTIPDISMFEVALNIDLTADAADLVLNSEFASLRELTAYQAHPDHQRVVEFLGKVKSEKRVIDYEF